MFYRLFMILLMSYATPALSEWRLTYHDINRVYDGDTFFINLKGLPPIFGHDLPIRVADMDAPELRSRCATETLKARERTYGALARDFFVDRLRQAEDIRVFNLRRDSFFRIIADVELDGVDLKKIMIDAGYAQTAVNGVITGWCNDPRVVNLVL